MEIAFLFALLDSDKWSTPLAIHNEFKRRGWSTRIYSLFEGDNPTYTNTGLLKLLDDLKRGYDPDIILHMDYGQFDDPLMDKSFHPKSFWIMECGDDPQNYDKNKAKAHKFDLLLTPDHPSYLKYTREGFKALWWTHFADTTIYKPMDVPQTRRAVSSRGRGGSQLMDYLEVITVGRFLNQNGFHGVEHAEFLNSAPIVIQNSRWGEITRRIFEAMACGKLVLTDRLKPETKISELFMDKISIVYYDNLIDCLSKMNYYFYNEKERSRIAMNGNNEVLLYHSQIRRVDEILNAYHKWQINSL